MGPFELKFLMIIIIIHFYYLNLHNFAFKKMHCLIFVKFHFHLSVIINLFIIAFQGYPTK